MLSRAGPSRGRLRGDSEGGEEAAGALGRIAATPWVSLGAAAPEMRESGRAAFGKRPAGGKSQIGERDAEKGGGLAGRHSVSDREGDGDGHGELGAKLQRGAAQGSRG